MEDLFPQKEGIDYSKLKITEEGSYSITRRRDAERIMNILNSTFKNIKELTITDVTACIGGDTLNFALRFKHVHSIELNAENFEALTNNVQVYGCNNVTLHHADSVKLFNWNTHVLYLDPPWGGKDYKQHKDLDLYMSDKRLDEWLEEILFRKNRPQYIVLKLPSNYNFKRFNFLVNIDNIKPYQIRSYVLVIIAVHKTGH
jgi:16S rRNA G966 N2-methylase RsmD